MMMSIQMRISILCAARNSLDSTLSSFNIITILQFVGLGLVTLLFIICYVVWSYRPSRPDLLEYKYGGTQCDIR